VPAAAATGASFLLRAKTFDIAKFGRDLCAIRAGAWAPGLRPCLAACLPVLLSTAMVAVAAGIGSGIIGSDIPGHSMLMGLVFQVAAVRSLGRFLMQRLGGEYQSKNQYSLWHDL